MLNDEKYDQFEIGGEIFLKFKPTIRNIRIIEKFLALESEDLIEITDYRNSKLIKIERHQFIVPKDAVFMGIF